MSPANSLKEKRVIAFGPFRLRAEERILEKDGRPVAIAEKTLALLCVLVDQRGELVEKDTLKRKVWPGTFVEDSNIAFQISTLRRVLEESANEPRFIATVPKRGYRFIADVVEELEPSEPLETLPETGAGPTNELIETSNTARNPRSVWVIAASLGIGLTLVIGFFSVVGSRRRQLPATLADKGAIVLADFDNKTGDPVFDGSLRQGLLVELEQSPVLSLLPEQRLYRTLGLMRQPASTRLSHEVAMTICQRTGSTLMVEGSVERMGAAYLLGLRGFSCGDGKLVDAEQAKADRREQVLDALSAMSARFRARVGEAAATLSTRNVSLAETTTASLAALKAYSMGWNVHMTRGAGEAIPLLEHAIAIDPEFAMAYATLGRMYADLDESDLSAKNLERAWTLKEHASDRERFFIAANYLSLVKGNLEESRRVAETWAQTYPRDAIPHTLLSGLANKALGRYEEAAAQARAALQLDPDFGMSYYNLAVNNVYLQRFDEARKVLTQAAARGLDIEEFQMLEYDLAFLRGDPAELDRVIAKIRQRARPRSWLTNMEAFRQAYSGHFGESRSMSRQAVAESEISNERERAGVWTAGMAVREALAGNKSFARKSAQQALLLSNNREVQYGAGLALAVVGDSAQARAIATELASRFPEDTSVRFNYIPVILAQVRLTDHRPSEAIDELRVASVTEMGASRSPVNTIFGALYPVYFRGLAFQDLKRGEEAAAEFQKIIDRSGLIGVDTVGALAYLQLGRSYRLAGNVPKARAAYQQFLNLWRDADADLPLRQIAQSEYGGLMRQTLRYFPRSVSDLPKGEVAR